MECSSPAVVVCNSKEELPHAYETVHYIYYIIEPGHEISNNEAF